MTALGLARVHREHFGHQKKNVPGSPNLEKASFGLPRTWLVDESRRINP
jgi:hypothetical protein